MKFKIALYLLLDVMFIDNNLITPLCFLTKPLDVWMCSVSLLQRALVNFYLN